MEEKGLMAKPSSFSSQWFRRRRRRFSSRTFVRLFAFLAIMTFLPPIFFHFRLKRHDQKKGEAEITKAYARVSELERQVEKLEEFLREQKQGHESLKLPGSKAENQAKYFSAKNKKVSEKATTAHNQGCPDLETAKTWNPSLKQQWQQAMVSFAPHVETLKTKVNEGYEASRDTIKPHLVKAQESLSPHVQTVKDLCGPYVEKVVAASQPHMEKATDILQPYTKPVRHTYGRFLTTATRYLNQIQTAFQKDENRRNPPTQKDEKHT